MNCREKKGRKKEREEVQIIHLRVLCRRNIARSTAREEVNIYSSLVKVLSHFTFHAAALYYLQLRFIINNFVINCHIAILQTWSCCSVIVVL